LGVPPFLAPPNPPENREVERIGKREKGNDSHLRNESRGKKGKRERKEGGLGW